MTTPDRWPYPGARWWKFDFHTHTPASEDYGKGPNQDALRRIAPKEWLLGYMRAAVDCVAVTDHNTGEWIDALKKALQQLEAENHADFRPLHLFPGVEITANAGVHVLAIFDPQRTGTDVAQLLGAVGFRGTRGGSDAAADRSPIQVVQAIAQAGGIPILGHVDAASGAFRVLSGSTLGPLLESRDLFAIEVWDRGSSKPPLYAERKLGWTEVLGSDAHHQNGQTGQRYPGSHFTWVKMATPSLEGLRLALLDGADFSVRRSDDPEPFEPVVLPEHFIESIEIFEARYMGRGQPQELRFSPWFNALVGGRGTGKSTVVHGLRLGYRRDGELKSLPEGNDARRTFERFAKVARSRGDDGGLQPDTRILVTLMRDGVRHRLRWSQDGQTTVVEEEANGVWRPSAGQSVKPERFPVRIFSQGQIAALAGESQEALLGVIDEPAGTGPAKTALEEAERRFFALRAQIREIDGRLKGREQVQVQFDDVRRKLASFEGKQHAEVLREYQLRTRQEREVHRQIDIAAEMAGRVGRLANELVPEDLPPGLFDAKGEMDREALAIIERLRAAVGDATRALRQTGEKLQAAARKERDTQSESAWAAAVAKAKAGYAALAEALKGQGVADPSEYGKLVQERQRLEGEAARFDSLEKQRVELVGEVEQQRERVRKARRALSKARQDFLGSALAQNPYVRIELLPYGRDPRAIERLLRDVLGVQNDRFGDDILVLEDDEPKRGVVADLLAGLPNDVAAAAEKIERALDRHAQRIEQACAGQGDFGGHFNNYLLRECQKRPELLDRLLVWSPDDALRVEYSPKGDGRDFKSIGQASAGQRAAAMLAFLLAHGAEPLVLDQPEDDLDNHLIYGLVVRQIRENKLHRQIVVVTHNPNIVVNGDAEMLHALDFAGGQCRVVMKGSLQESEMRDEVCRVMEGGREAFERRYQRLGREV